MMEGRSRIGQPPGLMSSARRSACHPQLLKAFWNARGCLTGYLVITLDGTLHVQARLQEKDVSRKQLPEYEGLEKGV